MAVLGEGIEPFALSALKYGLFALLFLFIWRSMRWAVRGLVDGTGARRAEDAARASGGRSRPTADPGGASNASCIHADGAKPRTVPRRDHLVVLGRAPECELRLDDTYVSQQHARIFARRKLVRGGPGLDERHLRERPAARRARAASSPATRSAWAPPSWSSGDEDRRRASPPTSAGSARATRTPTWSSRRSTRSPTGWAGTRAARSPRSSRWRRSRQLFQQRRGHARPAGQAGQPGRVRALAAKTRRSRGMGTTLTAARRTRAALRLAHVGDSRAYLMRAGAFRQLTDDHTLVARMVKAGEITEAEAEVHPHRNVITAPSGTEPDVAVDERPGPAARWRPGPAVQRRPHRHGDRGPDRGDPGDRARAAGRADRLMRAANRAGGIDNITVVVLDALGRGRATPSPPPAGRRGASAAGAGSRAGSPPWCCWSSRSSCCAPTWTASGTSASRPARSRCSRGSRPRPFGPVAVARRHRDRHRRGHAHPRCEVHRDLPQGISAESREDAFAIVEQIRSTSTAATEPPKPDQPRDGRRRGRRRRRRRQGNPVSARRDRAPRAGRRPLDRPGSAHRRARHLDRAYATAGPRAEGTQRRETSSSTAWCSRRCRSPGGWSCAGSRRAPTPCCTRSRSLLGGPGHRHALPDHGGARSSRRSPRNRRSGSIVGIGAFAATLWFLKDDRQLDALHVHARAWPASCCCSCRSCPGIGYEINGARLWVAGAVSFQPAEFGQDPDRDLPGGLPVGQARAAGERRGAVRLAASQGPRPAAAGVGRLARRAVPGTRHGRVAAVLRRVRGDAVGRQRPARATCGSGWSCSPRAPYIGYLAFGHVQDSGGLLAARAGPRQGHGDRVLPAGAGLVRDGDRRAWWAPGWDRARRR